MRSALCPKAMTRQKSSESGPQAIWSATVSELPVNINKLSFGQTCMAPGAGLPVTFSVTGDTSVSAAVRNASGGLVRSLGTFNVKEGNGAILGTAVTATVARSLMAPTYLT